METQAQRWTDYFSHLLNRPLLSICQHRKTWQSVDPTTREEIVIVIKQLIRGKVTEPDQIPTKALKAVIPRRHQMLSIPPFPRIWNIGKFPSVWKEGHLQKIINKEIPASVKTAKTLVFVPGKVFKSFCKEQFIVKCHSLYNIH